MGSDIQNFIIIFIIIYHVHKKRKKRERKKKERRKERKKGKIIKTNRHVESGGGAGTCGRLSLLLDSALLERGQLHTRLGQAGPRSWDLVALAIQLQPLEHGRAPAVPLDCSLFSLSFSNKMARRKAHSGLGLQAFSDLFKDFYLFIYLLIFFSLLFTLFLLFRVVTIHG
jgi:hypothetical protein